MSDDKPQSHSHMESLGQSILRLMTLRKKNNDDDE